MRVVTVEQMRSIEAEAEQRFGLDGPALMAFAGRSAAEIAAEWFGGDVAATRWLVLVGPGNNGGDGRVMAGHLAQRGAEVALFDWRTRRLTDAAGADRGDDLAAALADTDVVVDAWLGIGHTRPLSPAMVALNDLVRAAQARRHGPPQVIGLDAPSGVDCDSGAVDPGTLAANLTITLACPKIGLLLAPALAVVGDLRIGSIGLPDAMDLPGVAVMITPPMVAPLLPPRPLESNKGTFGKALIVAGSPSYPGAAVLAATAALRAGAGLVTIATTPALAAAYIGALPEVTFVLLPDDPAARAAAIVDAAREYTAIVLGPGLGQAPETRAWLFSCLDGLRALPDDQRPALVADADALNLLSHEAEWWRRLPPGSVLTPHPGEMARLVGDGRRVSGGGADRLPLARERAAAWGHIVLLKGAVTVIAAPEGDANARPWLNAAPNPALAAAGMGDTLAGIILALLAQGVAPFPAAALGAHLHSQAGAIAADALGFARAGLLATEVAHALPAARSRLEARSA